MIAIPMLHVSNLLLGIVHGAWDRSMHGRDHASFAFESISLVVGPVGDNSRGFAGRLLH